MLKENNLLPKLPKYVAACLNFPILCCSKTPADSDINENEVHQVQHNYVTKDEFSIVISTLNTVVSKINLISDKLNYRKKWGDVCPDNNTLEFPNITLSDEFPKLPSIHSSVDVVGELGQPSPKLTKPWLNDKDWFSLVTKPQIKSLSSRDRRSMSIKGKLSVNSSLIKGCFPLYRKSVGMPNQPRPDENSESTSFKVLIDAKDEEKLYSSDIWPEDCLVTRWVFYNNDVVKMGPHQP
ncbi:hypothetical protein HELRODRAFT_169030 [Helobdella robusta]|uniref:Uncharacterized protein n=1 Tax=Helobdella robusta TaxID=6412 RepID=T1F1A0_HELRO|nr:hypothetical protein HELRODRAFT_169030 [Helobdella robusta]ESO09090.1 hypothetical protein HELRODRAFT_169030 [Helobdella robusta]